MGVSAGEHFIARPDRRQNFCRRHPIVHLVLLKGWLVLALRYIKSVATRLINFMLR